MIIKENPILTLSEYERISELFELVEWGKREPLEIQAAFEKSSFVCIVYLENIMVGFGRTFDDGKYYATLCDVVIDPKHQGMGFGTQIVSNLKSRLDGYQFITLTAAPGKGNFYEKIGWKKQSSAFISPISKLQEEQHT